MRLEVAVHEGFNARAFRGDPRGEDEDRLPALVLQRPRKKSLDEVTLSLDRSESQVMRFMQQILFFCKKMFAEEFKDPEPATSEVSGQTFACILNRNHVSEANSAGRFLVKQHDVGRRVSRNFVDPFVEKAKPVLGATATEEIPPWEANLAGRSPSPTEENSVPANATSQPQFTRIGPKNLVTTVGNTALCNTRISNHKPL